MFLVFILDIPMLPKLAFSFILFTHSLSMTAACSFYSTFLKSHPHPGLLYLCIFVVLMIGPSVGRSIGMVRRHLFACVFNNTESPFQNIRAFVRSSNEFRFVQCFLFYLQLSHAVNKFLEFRYFFSSFLFIFYSFIHSICSALSLSLTLFVVLHFPCTRASIVLLTYLHKAILFLYPISTISKCVS